MAILAHTALVLALPTVLCSALCSAWGGRARRRQWVVLAETGLLAAAGLVALATAILLHLLLSRDFQVQYVYAHSSTYQPTLYVISALWAGQEGSLLVWSLFLGTVSAIVILQKRHWPSALWPHVLTTLGITQAFFILTLVTVQDPFTMHAVRPPEGTGILPILENPGMVIHPPIVFLGYAVYSVPFAFGMASLVAGRVDNSWLLGIRRWSLVAWLFLGLGILIGAWWAYVELGWGGYWSWDPVESASLVPWLTGTAYVHSLVAQERRGILKRWNMVLPITTFLLCMFATFVTRGGLIISDLHGFSRTMQPVGYYLLGFIGTVTVVSVVLLRLRRKALSDDRQLEQLLSRGSALLLSNLLLIGLGTAILVGITFPNTSQMLWGVRMHLSASFYNRVFTPLASSIVLLMGVCPLLGWGESSPRKLLQRMRCPAMGTIATAASLLVLGVRQPFTLLASMLIAFTAGNIVSEILRPIVKRRRRPRESTARAVIDLLSRNHRRYGARVVHLSILLIAVGVTGSSLHKTEELIALAPGDTATIHSYTLEYEDLAVLDEVSRQRHIATIGVYRGSSRIATLQPERNLHWNIQGHVTEVAIRSTLWEDLHIALDLPNERGLSTFRISIYPLITCLWAGGGLLLLGTLIAVWPSTGAHPKTYPTPVSRHLEAER